MIFDSPIRNNFFFISLGTMIFLETVFNLFITLIKAMKYFTFLILILVAIPLQGQEKKTEIPTAEIQIKTALLAAPDDKKEGAKVYGYDSNGNFVTLRKGTNDYVCIGDNPKNNGISVACYPDKLEAFMARGRELSAAGEKGQERQEIRDKEIASGKIKMPKEGMLFIYYGKQEGYNPATGELADGRFRYVIYTPNATTESTGLPDKPYAPGMPWLMDPGTPRAHIMITPE